MTSQWDAIIQRFIEGQLALSSFQNEFRETYLGGSASTELDAKSQLYFDRVLETAQDVGLPNDPRLFDETSYREYLIALRKRFRDGTLTFESPEY